MTKQLAVVALSLALHASVLHSQQPPASPPPHPRDSSALALPKYRYRLLGVYDENTGEPIPGVDVVDLLNGNKMVTSPSGAVSLIFLPDGGSLIRLRKLGYDLQTMTVAISPADTEPITVVMAPTVMLPTVVVKDSSQQYISPALRGFEQRKAAGLGHFIDEAEMRKDDNWTMANVLTSHFAGVQQSLSPTGQVYLVSTRKMCSGPALMSKCQAPVCYPNVYVDGARFLAPASANPNRVDFSTINPSDFAAAEFYSGADVPAEYSGTNADCGVLLLWTRER
ncbi:MAG TPA: hypothetical protein VIJ16_11155 [Gemmatimonadaceae bacterium]